jgi:hypothetical protein
LLLAVLLAGWFVAVPANPQFCIRSWATPDYRRRFRHFIAHNQVYAKRWNYSYTIDSRVYDWGRLRPKYWGKVDIIQNALETSCSWVLWLDADCVVMNQSIRLEQLTLHDANLVVTDAEVLGSFRVNNGAFLLRNSDWAKQFCQRWWSSSTQVAWAAWDNGGEPCQNFLVRIFFHTLVLSSPPPQLFGTRFSSWNSVQTIMVGGVLCHQ